MIEEQEPDTPLFWYDCPAKINWFLEILEKRQDGFHELITVMQTIDWCDRIGFQARFDQELILEGVPEGLPSGSENLILKAAYALREHTGTKLGASLQLQKNLPVGSGLGGGSSDAATTLYGLNRLWSCGCDRHELSMLAGSIGSDVSFFLKAPLAHCKGRGELVQPLENPRAHALVVVAPAYHAGTVGIYQSQALELESPRKTGFDYTAISSGKGQAENKAFNRLEKPFALLHPKAYQLLQRTRELNPGKTVCLSGSGSSFFMLCKDLETARGVKQRLQTELGSALPPGSHLKVLKTLQQDHLQG